jgi:Domain of unknown function (DUF5615)
MRPRRHGVAARTSSLGEALLDVHHSRIAAERLRASGYDVLAAFDYPELAVLADEEVLRRASADGRAVVTENAKDFDRIVRSWQRQASTIPG